MNVLKTTDYSDYITPHLSMWRKDFLGGGFCSLWKKANECGSVSFSEHEKYLIDSKKRLGLENEGIGVYKNKASDKSLSKYELFDYPMQVRDNGLLKVIMMILFPNTDPESTEHVYDTCNYDFYFSQVKFESFTDVIGPYRDSHFEMIIERDDEPAVKIMIYAEEIKYSKEKYIFYLENIITGQVWSYKEWI